MSPSPVLGTAPKIVSGVRSPAAARLEGAAWASRRSWAGGSAPGPRGAARSLKSTARSSRAAVPEAVQSWQLQAGSLGSVTSSLRVPGTFTASCGVFGRFPPPGGRASLAFRLSGRPGRARGTRRPRGARRQRGVPWVLLPAPAVLPSDGFGKTKSKHPVSLARPHAFLFFLSYKS